MMSRWNGPCATTRRAARARPDKRSEASAASAGGEPRARSVGLHPADHGPEDQTATIDCKATCARLNTSFTPRTRQRTEEREAASDCVRDDRRERCEEEQRDDERDLRQRDGVELAVCRHVDDQHDRCREADRHRPGGHCDGRGDRVLTVQPRRDTAREREQRDDEQRQREARSAVGVAFVDALCRPPLSLAAANQAVNCQPVVAPDVSLPCRPLPIARAPAP